jgi:DNA end-binding protein Ku
MRAIASLTISFGLVAIPVKLYSSTVASERIRFHFLRSSDGSRVEQRYVAVKDGKPVERSEMSRGYEVARDRYVVFTPDETRELEEAATHAIDIQQFAPLESVDPLYFFEAYYLAADKGALKPYSLLVRALGQSRQCAIGRWVSHGKEHIVIIRSLESGLVMHQLRFKSEVRDIKDLGIEVAAVSEDQLRLANRLIEQLSVKRFDPSDFTDEYRQRVQAAVDRKMKGKALSLAEPADHARASNVIDLMGALKASLDARRGKGSRRATHERPRRSSR